MMKRFLYGFATVLATAFLAACTADEGTLPGNDTEPVVTIYQYATALPYDVDTDTALRFVGNSATEQAYYFAEPTTDYEARIASSGEAGYIDYVIHNGTALSDVKGASYSDVVLTGLAGEYTISAVAVGGGKTSIRTVNFTGIKWTDVTTGTYYFDALAALGRGNLDPRPTVLQQCETDENLYRLKDVFGAGYHLKLNILPGYTGKDENGEYRFFRVPDTETSISYGDYGHIFVRDIGYWQGNDGFVTESGYESGMYEDGGCFLCLQYYVSAGSLGYDYDFFIAD